MADERPGWDALSQAQKVHELWRAANKRREDLDRAIGEELDFSLKLRHYKDDQGNVNDRRRIQPKGRELVSKLRHKGAEITKEMHLTVKAVDRGTDPKFADAAKWVLSYDINHPQKDYAQVREDFVTLALAARVGVMALDYVPGVGGFDGEVIPRIVDPRNFKWADGWKNPHDLTCPWAMEMRTMRVSDVKKMSKAGWKNTDKVGADSASGTVTTKGDPTLLPGTVRFPSGSSSSPSPGIGTSEPTCSILFAWFRNDDTRTSRMKEGSLRKLRPEQRYLLCQTCQYEDHEADGASLPKVAGPCPTCGGEMDRVDEVAESEEMLAYPNGRLTITAPFSDDAELYDDAWPYKIRSIPYAVMHGYPHPLEQIGMSDTAYDWSLQLIADSLLRQAYEQMSENRDIIIAPVDGLVDADNEPWMFADTQGRVAYWMGQGLPAVQHFQGTGVSPGFREVFGQVQSVLMRDMGTSDISLGSENTKNIPVGTIQALQTTGEVPVEHHKRRLWRAESIFFSVWLDMIRDTWTQKRLVRLSPEKGSEMFAEIMGADIPNADVIVSAAPALGSADEQEIRALQMALTAPPPMMDLLARKLNLSQSDVAEYQQKMDEFQQSQKPQQPPSSASQILVALSDILKAKPGYVSYEQVQAACAMAGLPIQQQMTPLQKVHQVHELVSSAPPPAAPPGMDGGPSFGGEAEGSQPPAMAGMQ